jgi:hypothetical protein
MFHGYVPEGGGKIWETSLEHPWQIYGDMKELYGNMFLGYIYATR